VISTVQMVSAGLLTGLAIVIAGRAAGWNPRLATEAAALACLLIIAWRVVANVFGLNEVLVPLVSLADLACLPLGAVGPGLVLLVGARPGHRTTFPLLVGGLSPFTINIVIL
jgi:hypothetical protein